MVNHGVENAIILHGVPPMVIFVVFPWYRESHRIRHGVFHMVLPREIFVTAIVVGFGVKPDVSTRYASLCDEHPFP